MKTGDTIGPYQILAPIGEGGMGEVFRARDTRLDRTVAIKVSKAAFGERFAREAKSVAALNHPNICTLHDVGPNYLVMEFIEGTPLRGPLPVEKAVEYASQILDALDAAHRKGFVHHDLKPANVLITKQGIKLLDFGLAQQTAPVGQNDETRTAVVGSGEIAGTPQYMPPEQLQGKPADARSDLFAFGCVLYELLSGKKAFDGENTASVIAAILEREPAALDLHPPLDRVIRKCLAKDPDERFQTARDLKTALAWAMDQRATAAPARARRWLWAVAGGTLMLGALIGWVVKGRTQTSAAERALRFQLSPPEGGQFDTSRGFAVSPDGRTLAFVANPPGKFGLRVRSFDHTADRAWPGTEQAVLPFWSPDGSSLAYFASGKLWRVDLGGGAPVVICDAPFVSGGDWGADGSIVFGSQSGLRRVPASGGTPELITTLDAGGGESLHGSPQLLPGGRILFQVRGKAEQAGIYAASLANPAKRVRLVSAAGSGIYAAGHLLWLRGSTLVAQRLDPERLTLSGEAIPIADPVGMRPFGGTVASGSAGVGRILVHGRSTGAQLTWFDRSGRVAGTLGQPDNYATSRVSPDGRQVAVARGTGGGSDLWMVDVERDTRRRFTFLPGYSMHPVWSPDGQQVIFRVGPPGNLYRKGVSGAGNEQRLIESANPQWPADWSRDGRMVLYYETAKETQRDLWVLSVGPDGNPSTGAVPRPYLRTRANEYQARFAPVANPGWVAYTSDESGRDEVYLQAFPEPRGKFQVSTGGGSHPEWSPDSKELFFMSPDGKLMAADLKLASDSAVSSTPRELFALPTGGSVFSPYAIAPDGKRFLVLIPAGGSQPLEVIVNWTALLRKEPPAE